MSELRGICTNRDGSVSIICPADDCIFFLMHGGGISNAFTWRFGFRKWMEDKVSLTTIITWWIKNEVPEAMSLEWEIAKFVREKHWRPDRPDREQLARRWIEALDRGGLTEREAVSLIVEKDAPAWSTAHEIVHKHEIPEDRRYRNAWRRSHNGGPIWIDDGKAIAIDEARLWASYEQEAI